jgi:hypothetical protein
MPEKVAADVFKNAGMAVSNTGFYTLYVDHGNGPEYFGLYTLVEEVDGTVLDTLSYAVTMTFTKVLKRCINMPSKEHKRSVVI